MVDDVTKFCMKLPKVRNIQGVSLKVCYIDFQWMLMPECCYLYKDFIEGPIELFFYENELMVPMVLL